uniref:Nickel/cobalt transporter regulator n=1 Tax=Candidatus Kentrum sp. FM TaxID=2126340 RepID=A0A450S2J5_9GAMM|nr:MAG: hypothetical protein BECKFM1743C_GA0114222_1003112 [Candidatus Kentron sp. FM]VFJ49098.1 MAG: hypothetical protein BECKFM1743A_GA0114220_100671 [Candidatus Kentron sp. FM]VFK08351.1 MAG: hypothetical protein BECKFM1743B_GA0114221_100671 [Candidatus Kentron sp. FM]
MQKSLAFLFSCLLSGLITARIVVAADIAATHVYHNHMPNFWPYYDVGQYDSLPVGTPIRYTSDGQVIRLKENPPSSEAAPQTNKA